MLPAFVNRQDIDIVDSVPVFVVSGYLVRHLSAFIRLLFRSTRTQYLPVAAPLPRK